MKKYTNEELLEMEAIDIYKLVLKGYIKRFPKGFWEGEEGIENAKDCTKYMIEKILVLDEDMLKEKLSTKLFNDNRLGSMLVYCFKASPFKAINSIYPNKYKPWEFKVSPSCLWKDKDNGIKATKWLIEEKLKLTEKEIKEQLSRELFEKNGLRGMLRHCFNDSPYLAITMSYPNKYKKEELKNYWFRKNLL